jgi:diguanylate cyclase (GGDEF)-like protein/PAS domain S-box-containing protein
MQSAGPRAEAGSWTYDPASGRLWWSMGLYRLHQLDPERFTPDFPSAMAFLPLESRERAGQAIERTCKTGEPQQLQIVVIRADGTPLNVRMTCAASVDAGKPLQVAGTMADIGHQESQAPIGQLPDHSGHGTTLHWQIAMENSGIGLWDWNLQTNTAHFSSAWVKAALGYDSTDLQFDLNIWMTRIHPDDVPRARTDLKAHLQGLTPVYCNEHRLRHKDGDYRWVLMSGKVTEWTPDGRALRMLGTNMDIHQKKLSEQALAESEARFRQTLHEAKELAQVTLSSIGEGVIRTDAAGVITLCNPTAEALLGHRAQSIIGAAFDDIVSLLAWDGALVQTPLRNTLETGTSQRLPMFTRLRAADGAMTPVSVSVSPIRGVGGAIRGAVAVFQDISATLNFTEKLAFQARHDALTELPNRRALEEYLGTRLRESAETPPTRFLMFIDLDHFKVINDTCGHTAGDRLLREVANLLRALLRPEDFIARLGGDEFAVVVCDVGEAVTERICEKLLSAVDKFRFTHEGRVFAAGLSIGLVALDDAQREVSDVLAQADMACYAAKNTGRGRLYRYRPDDSRIVQARRTMDWSQRIRRGIEENRFRVYLQQVVDAGGRPEGYESLIRFEDEAGRIISPADFLPAAKRLGLMTSIDRWVCQSVFDLLSNVVLPHGYISVNLVPSSISDPQFVSWLLTELRRRPTLAGRLRFEITETEQLQVTEAELELFRALRELGFGIFLDDFGSGYNSFELLKRLPVDGIKLDGGVVRDYLTDPVDQALVQAAVSIARNMDLKLVAEGIENQLILDALKAIGIRHFQGYLFHRPDAFERQLAA